MIVKTKMKTVVKEKNTLAFILLCFAAYGVQVLDCYALSHIGDAGIILSLDFLGLALLLVLLGWSVGRAFRHPYRAVAGVLICALCIMQFIQNKKIIW
jgi:hypothetical protein